MNGLPLWSIIFGFAYGAAIGSFLNVVIYRMPLGLKLGEPKHSFCPICKQRLLIPDLFPIFSWLFLGGKCRHCKVSIPPRYVIVEVILALLWSLIWYQNLVLKLDVATALAYMAVSGALLAAVFIDLRWYIIPDQINAFILFVGLALGFYNVSQNAPGAWIFGMPSTIAGALLGFGILWFITLLGRLLFGKDAMGHGDIKLARGVGALLLPVLAGMSFALAIIFGAFLGVGQILFRRAQENKQLRTISENVKTAGTLQVNQSQNGSEENLEKKVLELDDEEETYEPETIGSIFKCGLGYLLLIDVIGLFIPKLYENWFGENPYSTEDIDEEEEVGWTTIPFGPYLALGAILCMVAQPQILGLWNEYLKYLGIE